MNEREQISALMDGELSPAERDALLARLSREPALADTWRRYQLAHAALQHEAPFATDLSARVMQALDDEPVVLAPRALPHTSTATILWRKAWVRTLGGMALAASVTFGMMSVLQTNGGSVADVSSHDFKALYQAAAHPAVLMVSADSTTEAQPAKATEVVAMNDDERENAYMLAHAEYSERGLQDGILPFARVAGQSEDY